MPDTPEATPVISDESFSKSRFCAASRLDRSEIGLRTVQPGNCEVKTGETAVQRAKVYFRHLDTGQGFLKFAEAPV